jgi:predicted enzyme related to lactoylglutathione lyase
VERQRDGDGRCGDDGDTLRAVSNFRERETIMGNPFVHIELNTDDVAKAQKFYKGLFDWAFKPMAMGYTGIGVGGNGTGGGMQKKAMAKSPTMWLPYVEVDDVRACTMKAKKMGATVMVDYMPIDEMGAIGVFVDPTGAAIGVWEAAKKTTGTKKGKTSAPKTKSVALSAKKATKGSAKKTAKTAKRSAGKTAGAAKGKPASTSMAKTAGKPAGRMAGKTANRSGAKKR